MGGMVPVLRVGRQLAVHDGDHIQGPTRLHRVMNDVQPGAHPHRDLGLGSGFLQRDQTAVGQVPRKARRLLQAQSLSTATPQAIRPHQQGGRQTQPLLGANRDRCPMRLHLDQPLLQPQRHPLRLHGLQQQLVQIGPVDAGVGRAIDALRALAQRQTAQRPARAGVTRLQRVRETGHTAQAGLQPPIAQDAGDVRPDLDACTHFGKCRRLFQHRHRGALARERQRSGQTADAATGHKNLRCWNVHARIVPGACVRQNPDNRAP